jgi:hypothetical protein
LEHEKKQIARRLPPQFVRQILNDFNAGDLDALTAAARLRVGQSRLYELRSAWLKNRFGFTAGASGGDHWGPWPADVRKFLVEFVPLQRPPNYQLIADELSRRFDFVRARSTVAGYVQTHLGSLIPKAEPTPRPRRRWQRAQLGELWQHDSSIHPWWPTSDKPVLLLTIDDHSRKIVAGRFVSADTTWLHFEHFRAAFETHGLPAAIYTDALSLFGHTPTSDSLDPCSQFQRALTALGVAHLVAPSPQAKGKIERRFGTLQNRLVTLLAFETVTDFGPANEVLRMEIHRHNTSLCRTTGLRPDEAWTQALAQKRSRLQPIPQKSLLDLHLSLQLNRRVNADNTIDFLGQAWSIAPTPKRTVTLIHHPEKCFWVIPHPPQPPDYRWPQILGSYSL